MPWTPGDVPKHNKRLSGKSKRKWSNIANSILAQGGDESKAIRIANSQVRPSVAAVQRKLRKNKGV